MFWGKFCCLASLPERCQRRRRGDKRRKRHLFTCTLANRFSSPPFHLTLLLLLLLRLHLPLLLLLLPSSSSPTWCFLLWLLITTSCFSSSVQVQTILVASFLVSKSLTVHFYITPFLLLSDSPVFSETVKTLWGSEEVKKGAKELFLMKPFFSKEMLLSFARLNNTKTQQ